MAKSISVSLLGVKGGPAIRPGSNMPTSYLVRIGHKNIVVDAGLGVSRGICDQGLALTDFDLVLVTHLHSDHYLELGPLFHTAWVAGLKREIPVIGPSGLAHYWQHFCASMNFDIALRIEDEGRCDFSALAKLSTLHEGIVYQDADLTITAMRNDHPPIVESYALKFEAFGRSIVLSGDTAFMPQMIKFASGADLLVHEAMLIDGVDALVAKMQNGDARLRQHIIRSHTSAEDVGRIAHQAGVRRLALNHFVPDGDPNFTEDKWEAEVRRHFAGQLIMGRDGIRIDV